MSEQTTTDMVLGFVPEAKFGRDHWSTLLYIETRLVDTGGYVICCDARMRTHGFNHRIYHHRPSAQREHNKYLIAQIDRHGQYGTRLNDGTVIPQHDDWSCLQDLAVAGYLVGDARQEPLRVYDGIIAEADRAARIKLADWVRDETDETGVDVGANIYLTMRGFQVTAALRVHKAQGGSTQSFVLPGGITDVS